MATEGEVVVTDAVPSTRRLDTRTMTNGASHVVDREVHVIGDDTTPGATARVTNAAPAIADYGMVVRQAGMRRSGSATYGASSSDGGGVSSGTAGGTSISLAYLFHPSSVTTLLYRLQRLVVTWSGGVGGADALLKLTLITAENGTPGGTSNNLVLNNQGNAASSAIFRSGATGTPTRPGSPIDTVQINLGASGCAIFGPPDNADGQDYEMRKSQAEGWEVRLVVNTAPTVAAQFSISASWREEAS